MREKLYDNCSCYARVINYSHAVRKSNKTRANKSKRKSYNLPFIFLILLSTLTSRHKCFLTHKKIVKPYFLEEMKSISIETGCDCVWQQLNILNENEEHMEAIAYVLMTFSAFLLLLKTNVIWMLKVSNALEMSQITQKSRFWVAQLFTVIKVFGSYGI